MIKSVSVLGCGWLGLPLAKFLVSKEIKVNGSTTSIDKLDLLIKNGINAFNVILNPDIRTKNFDEFLKSDLLIINIPPGRVENKILFHSEQIKEIVNFLKNSKVKKVIYVSSTSVYGEDCGIITELSETIPITDGGKAVKEAEEILKDYLRDNLAVVRFGGLIGEERHPGRFLSYKKVFEEGNRPINLIHQKDCINIIWEIIKQNKYGEIFNGVCSGHPTKKEFYSKAADKLGINKPEFIDSPEKEYKIVSNQKVKEVLNYNFIFDDPFQMIERK